MATIDQTRDSSRPPDEVCLTAQQAEAYSLVFERLAHTAHDDGDERRAIVLAQRALRLLADAGDPSPSFPEDWFHDLPGNSAVPKPAPVVGPEVGRP
jgi:hypothetical protein